MMRESLALYISFNILWSSIHSLLPIKKDPSVAEPIIYTVSTLYTRRKKGIVVNDWGRQRNEVNNSVKMESCYKTGIGRGL
jgi:hypothetical protein